MRIRIGEQEIDAAICEGAVNIAEGTYPFVDIATAKPMTAAQISDIKKAGFSALDDTGMVTRRFCGYSELYEIRTTFVKKENSEQQLLKTGAKLDAVSAQHMALARLAAAAVTDAVAAESIAAWPDWREDTIYQAGELVRHGASLYRVEQSHTSQAHQQPGDGGMLAVYRPIQAATDRQTLPWVNCEILDIGDRREYEGVVYEVYTSPGMNIWTPDSAPTIWRVVEA